MSQRTSNKDVDDWDTDPDFVRDMDEMDQRWGYSKRTVGSIDMNELIDNVRREHQNLREKFKHSSQLGDLSRTNFPEQYRRTNPLGSGNFNEEKVSKTEVKREVIKSETSSYVKESNDSVLSETFHESSYSHKPQYTTKTTYSQSKPATPPVAPKPDLSDLSSRLARSRLETQPMRLYEKDTVITTDPPRQFKDSSATKTIFREEQKSSFSKSPTNDVPRSSSRVSPPHAFSKSIQDKIDAFKKEFEDIEHKVARKSDISKVITKTTNVDKKIDDIQYVTRSNEKINSSSPRSPLSPEGARPTSASAVYGGNKPKASIKSLSEKFETLGRESSDDFKRRMEERRQEFFDRIKSQVRETRKGLDGFDIGDSDDDERNGNEHVPQTGGMKQFAAKLNSSSPPLYGSTLSKLSNNSVGSSKPKVYTRRETTEEKVVSRFVKENDKIIHDETKRNVERTSSVHGSSEDEADAPSSIKYLDRELRKSPQQRTQSPIDEIKRKVPVVEAEPTGAGLMARTLYDYQASEEDELTFDVDDLITNIEKVDQGWYKGLITKNGRKRVGLFPAIYVKLLNDTSEY